MVTSEEEQKEAMVAAYQVGHVFRVEQWVQEFCCQVDGRLRYWNSGGFGDCEGGRLLFVIIIFHQGWF